MSVTYSNTSSNIIDTTSPSTSTIVAKLRRLKIEESILFQNVNKCVSASSQSNIETGQSNYLTFSEFKKFHAETKNSYSELKQLFQDIKERTSSKEVLKSIDIDEIKKCTHELETKMKSYKLYLHTEISNLKSAERQLNQKLNDPIPMRYIKRKPKMPTAKYTEIVPSPVKTIMASPFKCSEVQEFQEFMQSSKNRYGGWDEYHHNIFVNIWQKYFDAENLIATNKELAYNNIKESEEFYLFLREIAPKLLGIKEEEVISHVKWYIKYLHLKDRQQQAIDKWRSNRRMMTSYNVKNEAAVECTNKKKCVNKNKTTRGNRQCNLNNIMDYLNSQDQIRPEHKPCRFNRKCLGEEVRPEYNKSFDENGDNDKQGVHFFKSTMQWNLRCASENTKTERKTNNNIENVKKLGIPMWRVGL